MGKSQRTKGKVGEREWASFLRNAGFASARRGVQYSGNTGGKSPDVQCDELEAFHCEVKRQERGLNLHDAWAQASRDASCSQIPYVAHRKNNCRWLVTVDGADFMRLVRAYIEDV
jgi:hypothetical protein